MLHGHVMLSPEFAIGANTKGGGTIDFFIEQKKWGLELLRGRDRLVEHMDRFEPEGQYYSMIKSREMEEYIVLDFTVSRPVKTRPEYAHRLYYIVFSERYRHVDVLEAGNLSTVSSFTLPENPDCHGASP
ncbi:uncharacterized protein ACHE_31275S [Aspergillus chevalieri]|uniref:Uncharacterized protein n=1 Tax=Aspergillus chevalieri TaxID=182096 RepID=A0A7R7ZMA4_ASPCH|nr:uncharacterized protein ACHE_31275S [Aspergillus chevalieri]BCR87288.1 hypothetical protein ACHE_31275S [Aspergillus chevalieri]